VFRTPCGNLIRFGSPEWPGRACGTKSGPGDAPARNCCPSEGVKRFRIT